MSGSGSIAVLLKRATPTPGHERHALVQDANSRRGTLPIMASQACSTEEVYSAQAVGMKTLPDETPPRQTMAAAPLSALPAVARAEREFKSILQNVWQTSCVGRTGARRELGVGVGLC